MRNEELKAGRRLLLTLLLVLGLAAEAGAASRELFLTRLLHARGLGGEQDGAAFILRTGLVTDAVGDLNAPVTRREALRWCVQSLGLSFEADTLSNTLSSFKDTHSLTDFERGALFVATRMEPPLLAQGENFRGGQPLSDKDMETLLQNVRRASRGLKLDVTLAPMKGLRLHIHRDGVMTGIPRWRVYADGFKDKDSSDASLQSFKAQGFDVGQMQAQQDWAIRTPVLDDYSVVHRLTGLIKKRGLKARIVPSVSNSNFSLAPRYWVLLTVDPTFWNMVPVSSEDGPRVLAPLSQIVRTHGLKTAINGGFFAVTGRNRGFPIGLLRVGGNLVNAPYAGRGCLGWDEEDGARFGVVSQVNGELIGDEGESWADMPFIIQAGPMLLKDGRAVLEPEGFSNSILSMRHPRSAVGLTAEGDWFIMAVDGRNGMHASGATLSELTGILKTYRAAWALNLDGGGSTEIIVNGKIYNSPSEGKERPISYALGIAPANRGE